MIRLLILSAFLVAACSKSPGLPTPPGLREYVVLPSATSTAISTYNEPHYAYIIPDDKRRNQLLVFLRAQEQSLKTTASSYALLHPKDTTP